MANTVLRYTDHRLWQRNSKSLIAAAAVFTTIFFYMIYSAGSRSNSGGFSHSYGTVAPREAAGNATLGFGKVLAVSGRTSWRTRGLQAAAKISKVDVTIPTQPFIGDELVKAFEDIGAQNPGTKRPKPGSAKAWMAHLDMVKYVVASGIDTALIIEDDVDWDVTIRDQMKLVSDNVRAFTKMTDQDSSPYGSAWDVLWVGHCGEVTKPETVKLEYPDPSLMETKLYAGWSKKWLANIQEGNRAVQKTHMTICTFGYGISRDGAQNVLRLLAKGQNEAYDVAMMTACQAGLLRCISVNPELMHHYNPKDGTGYVSPNDEANGRGHSAGEDAFERLMGTTANMKNSARCAALFNDVCPQPPTKAEDY